MNSQWDGTGVSFDSETWKGIAKLLHPGGFLFVFAGTVNDDLISVAMRKAGLRKFHCLRGWVNGSGFPKATRVDVQVDQAAGVEREEIGCPSHIHSRGKSTSFPKRPGEKTVEESGRKKPQVADFQLTAPVTPLAKTWEGHRYGLQAIKPAIETVLVFQKPYEGRAVDCITETGAGALWIDGARLGGRWWRSTTTRDDMRGGNYIKDERKRIDLGEPQESHSKGRWPANFFLEHHPGCRYVGTRKIKGTGEVTQGGRKSVGGIMNAIGELRNSKHQGFSDSDGLESVANWECVESCPVQKLGEQSGERPSGGRSGTYNGQGFMGHRRSQDGKPVRSVESSTGTASRFFFQSHWMHERLEQSDPVFYCGKATRKERDAGLDELPLKMRHRVNGGHGLEDDPKFAPVEARNIHPTVKAIALTKWLATLLLPPEEYAPRRLLVPFAGSGSEMIGALLAGWEEVVGVELSREYTDIARARISWWQKWIEMGCTDVNAILQDGVKLEQERPEGQLSMFE